MLSLVALAGCATSGPNHVYFTVEDSPAVHDHGPTRARVDGVAAPGEQVLGLAYDFNTDHLFVRVAPAQVIRVIERPSGKILRDMPLPPDLQTDGSADLAIRSSDRHLFAVYPDGRAVAELTLFGKFVQRFDLHGLDGLIGGLAYDQRRARLLVLAGNKVHAFTDNGVETETTVLHGEVRPVSLGFDSDARHYFVPLPDGNSVGEFDVKGELFTTIPTGPVNALAAGARSFVRVF